MTELTALANYWDETADEIDVDSPESSFEIEHAAIASTLRACATELRRNCQEPPC